MVKKNNSTHYIFPLFLFLIAAVLSAFKLNGSSVGMYNQYFYGTGFKDPNLLLGQIRSIRSDEWMVGTPWTMAQARDNFAVNNDLYLAGQNFSLTDAPVKSWIAIFEPQHWAFFILPLEQAFAFKWWFKAFFLATAVYVLVMMLTGDDVPVSALAALSFVFSPFIQWWYSTSVTEIASCGIFTFIFFIQIINNIARPIRSLINGFMFVYFAVCFAITMYPPFQIPLAMFFFFVGVGYLLSKWRELGVKNIRRLMVVVTVCIISIGILLASYYVSNEFSIRSLANTVYPGVRQSGGGNLGFLKSIAGIFNIQLLDNISPPKPFGGNQSEASSFFFYSFLLLPFYLFFLVRSIVRRQHIDLPLLFSLVSLGIFLVWGKFNLPSILAKLLLLNFVDPYRMLFALGIINHIIIIYYLARLKIAQSLEYKIIAAIYSVGTSFAVYRMGIYIKANWPKYLDSNPKILLISIAVGTMMALLLYQKKLAFFSAFLAFTLLSTFSVNPVYRGLSPLRDEKFVEVVDRIHAQDPQAAWAAYDSLILGNYLASNGLKVLNGTYYYPNLAFWSQFDSTGEYSDVYNRFEHVTLVSSNDPDRIEFLLPQADVIQIKISPCNRLLKKLGVKYYIFTSLPEETFCLTQVGNLEYPNMSIHIFKRND